MDGSSVKNEAAVGRQIKALRRRLYGLILMRGFGLCLLTVGLWVGASLAMDWTFRWPWGQRVVLLGMGVGLAGWVGYRRLWKPLSQTVSDGQLAVWVEGAYPRLAGRWLAATELNEEVGRRQGASAELVAAAVRAGEGAGGDGEVMMSRVIRPAYAARARGQGLLGVMVGLAVVLAGVLPGSRETMGIWWQRNVVLWEVNWPTRTMLTLMSVGGQEVMHPRGDDWELLVKAEGRLPGRVIAEMVVMDDEGTKSERQELLAMGGGIYRLGVRNVVEEMRVKVSGGDAVSGWVKVKPVDRPTVKSLVMRANPPGYTGLGVMDWQAGMTVFEVPTGSRVEVRVTATGKVEEATLSVEGQAGVKMKKDGEEWQAVVEPGALMGGVWLIGVRDGKGLWNQPEMKVVVKVKADREPMVSAGLEGVGGLVLPRGLLPVVWSARDDYGVGEVKVVGRWMVNEEGQAKEKSFTEAVKLEERGRRQVRGLEVVDLQGKDVPVGATLAVEVVAWDENTVTGAGKGTSATVFVKVVSEADLRAELLRREQEQRMELERAIKDQEDVETELRAMLAGGGAGTWTNTQREGLARLQGRQRSLVERVGVIHAQMAMLVGEMVNNRLEESDGPVVMRMKSRVVEPLEGLSKRGLAEVLEAMEQARGSEEAGTRSEALGRAGAMQQAAAQRMRQVLGHMAHWASYQEAVQLLQETLRMQGEVREATRRELEKRVSELFDG